MKSIAEVLASIALKADPFAHLAELAELGTDAFVLRRLEIATMLKRLKEERKEISIHL